MIRSRGIDSAPSMWPGPVLLLGAHVDQDDLAPVVQLLQLLEAHGAEASAVFQARGYRTTRNQITIVHLSSGKLDLPSTHLR